MTFIILGLSKGKTQTIPIQKTTKMKNFFVILTCLVFLSPLSFAKDSLWVSLGAELGLAVDWSSTNPEMAVYSLDENYNYLPFQQARGNKAWEGQTLVFEHIYTNIDLIVRPMEGGKIAYEFVVYPGGDLSQIKLVKEAFLNKDTFLASGLHAAQDEAGTDEKKVEVKLNKSENRLGFEVGTYEVAQALSISFLL